LAGGGAARTWRGPRRASDRPRMDAALPHGERARDGDGRDDVARRGRRARVRDPGRCGRSGRDDADRDGRTDRGRRLGRHGRARRTRRALEVAKGLVVVGSGEFKAKDGCTLKTIIDLAFSFLPTLSARVGRGNIPSGLPRRRPCESLAPLTFWSALERPAA